MTIREREHETLALDGSEEHANCAAHARHGTNVGPVGAHPSERIERGHYSNAGGLRSENAIEYTPFHFWFPVSEETDSPTRLSTYSHLKFEAPHQSPLAPRCPPRCSCQRCGRIVRGRPAPGRAP